MAHGGHGGHGGGAEEGPPAEGGGVAAAAYGFAGGGDNSAAESGWIEVGAHAQGAVKYGLTSQQRAEVGALAKRLLDAGRVEWLKARPGVCGCLCAVLMLRLSRQLPPTAETCD